MAHSLIRISFMQKSWRFALLKACLLGAFFGRCEAASPVELEVQLEQTTTGPSVRLSWLSIPGERYEIVATDSLIGEAVWQRVETGPLEGDGAPLEFLVDLGFERPSGFFRVLASDNDSTGQVIQDGIVLPDNPYVALGNSQIFSVSFPDGGNPTWSLFGLESTVLGSIGDSGVYVAPTMKPELPFVGILAQNTSRPDRFSASTAILVPSDEIRINRNQAIEILQRTVIDSHPRKSELLALGLHEPIGRADELRVYDPNRTLGQSEVAGTDPCWFFLVDEDPTSNWMHPVRYVKIDCRSGDLLQNESAFWYPELNGQPFWNRVKDRESVHDRVFVGETVGPELEEEPVGLVEVDLNGLRPLNASPRQRALVPLADEFIPIPKMFPGVANACNCPDTRRRHALIGVMSPEEDRLVVSGNDWETLFQDNAYTTTLISDGSSAKVRKQLDEWRTIIRPCDIVVVMLLGHGIQGSISRISSGDLVRAFRLIPTGAKYLVMESCDAGHVFDIFNKDDLTPRVEILTATDKVDPDAKIQITGTSPLIVGFTSQSGFTRALMACFSRFDTLSEVHKCLTNPTDIGLAAFRMKIAGPRLERVGEPDIDQDGVLDKVEVAMGLNPGTSDTDGDGVCDGIEYGQTATLEFQVGLARGDLISRGKKKPKISNSSAPARVLNGETYRFQLLVKDGIPFRSGPVTFSNPFGFGPQNGFFIDQGALPEGITLDRATGLIQGSPRSFGQFNFTIRYVDAIGVKATKSFEMRAVNALGKTGRVRVSSNGDGNERDDHITLREAVLLATGKLSQDALKKDPKPDDDLFEGELRWISGEFGAPFQNTILFEEPMTIELTEGPLVFDTHASTLVMGEKRIRLKADTGPVFDFQGDRNTLQDIAFINVSSGSAIRISGQGNYIGEPFSLWQHPSLVIQGGGLGTGVEVTGSRNTLASFSIQGFGAGLLLKEGAAYNTIDSMRCGKNRTGIELLGGANHNRIFDCRMGLEFAETDTHLPQALPNREHGLVLRGGAQFNLIEACGMAANGMNGILVDGESSDSNIFRRLQIGSAQEFRGVGSVVTANGGNGIEFANGASENVIEDCVLSENLGNGILLTGLQTDNNVIGGHNERPVEITQSSASGDAVWIKDGASGNEIAVTIKKSGRGGVIMEGKMTRDNRITCRKYSTVLGDFVVPSEVSNCFGAGIFIGGEATDNIVEEWTRVENCGSGIVIDGAGTKNNCVQEVVIKNSSTNGIQLSNRAQ